MMVNVQRTTVAHSGVIEGSPGSPMTREGHTYIAEQRNAANSVLLGTHKMDYSDQPRILVC